MSFVEDVNDFFGGVTDLTSTLFDNTGKVLSSVDNFAKTLSSAELTSTKKKETTMIAGTAIDGNMLLIAGAGIVGIIALIALVKS
jgi:hypothetical protein